MEGMEKELHLPLKCSKDKVRVKTSVIYGEGYRIWCSGCGVDVRGVEAENILRECVRYLLAKENIERFDSRFVIGLKEALTASFYDSVGEFIKPDFRDFYVDF